MTAKKNRAESSLGAPVTYIDLFCGCGGFSMGLEQAGLQCLAAIDNNKHAIDAFKENFPDVPHILQEDLLTGT
jgi:DNA (cytosine-5)-methyltransferase 1